MDIESFRGVEIMEFSKATAAFQNPAMSEQVRKMCEKSPGIAPHCQHAQGGRGVVKVDLMQPRWSKVGSMHQFKLN